ncbi:DUF502 domain-containing protein [Kordiimonas marina]|uniref:DUF502 domain-containing protein n=1 Tax=Kordiimonas marina TaxID=2872312 RepID=UPI001FF46B74|nr:DUF502 domain-containing protein [Kordiimonas marina]MCJ9430639.1 DUF502 domain-containing protein [Kordiimonas marina]
MTTKPSLAANIRRNVLVGIFTLVPLWLTLLLLSVVLDFIRDLASPLLKWLTAGVKPDAGPLYTVITHPWLQTSLALIVMLLLFYVVGWLASRWAGKKLLDLLDYIIDRIPVAKSIYKTIKRLTDVMQKEPADIQRVVLIEFPSPDMKTVGLVTQTFKDSDTGKELAAVYVPTTPNPTSGYLEIVPVEKLVVTNWKLDEAMSFIISGGADVPNRFVWDRPTPKEAPDIPVEKQVD